jgi:hypothetical protein
VERSGAGGRGASVADYAAAAQTSADRKGRMNIRASGGRKSVFEPLQFAFQLDFPTSTKSRKKRKIWMIGLKKG